MRQLEITQQLAKNCSHPDYLSMISYIYICMILMQICICSLNTRKKYEFSRKFAILHRACNSTEWEGNVAIFRTSTYFEKKFEKVVLLTKGFFIYFFCLFKTLLVFRLYYILETVFHISGTNRFLSMLPTVLCYYVAYIRGWWPGRAPK